ncbi:hypothetical protein G6O69_28470 [Pseudenhygromyxa sp. WMMC2535]|uniref:hypothetical protein n=1 Tax=Pseudenhygromyxa sp. WMMC2535 TaxID=2712867 RepID=UPI0015520745|nr:hypothetical protein [Pseudenhygromyxa sp. WMMC2535]NVB41801.1 hypothetical protein [Pseudenhygromyxa sp. WMMC2535]
MLTIVADTEGRFCDLEMVFDQSKASGDIALHGVGDDLERGRAFSIDTSAPVRWHLDDTSGYLRIQVGDERPTSWLRVGENDLWLGLARNDMLAVIVYTTTVLDPVGAEEARWLDEIGT